MTRAASNRNSSANRAAVARLKTERRRLIKKRHATGAGRWIQLNAAALDEYFRACFSTGKAGLRLDILQYPYALLALGGYGRAEQCIHSDVDLLILFEKRVPAAAEYLVQEIIYPLWDLGLDVGHATRSINETIQLACRDFEVLTSLLDARFICGMSLLFHELMKQLRRRLINIRPRQIIDWLVDANKKRHGRFGDSSYLLEPNIKEGQGGLRDYHTMLWIARIQSGAKTIRDLEYDGFLSHNEFSLLTASLNFIWQMRNNLHYLTGRKCDQLHLEYQSQLADIINLTGTKGLLPVERLLGKLHLHMEFVKQCHGNFLTEVQQGRGRPDRKRADTGTAGLEIRRGVLQFASSEDILRRPLLLIEIFLESALRKMPLGVEAQRLVREFGHLAEQKLRPDRRAAEIFEHLLVRPADSLPTLNQMLITGFLERFIPCWGQVVNRIQFDRYHLYPVARHLLLTVRHLKQLGSSGEKDQNHLCRQVYREVKSKRAMFWAALLHDIGKGVPEKGHAERGAEIAREILKEKGLAPQDVETACFLIKHHLLLMKTATRRDISEEETVVACGRRIRSAERLRMLYLLSVADAMATGPKAWNQWTASLMRDLFLRVRKVLGKRELVSDRAETAIEAKKQKLLSLQQNTVAAGQAEQLFTILSRRYLLHFDAEMIDKHLRLYQRLGNRRFAWNIAGTGQAADARQVTICAHDRPGLLSRIAGVFTLNNVNIMHVRIFTWHNRTALDVFEVSAPPDRIFEKQRWDRIALQLDKALGDEMDLGARLKYLRRSYRKPETAGEHRPQTVKIDNFSSSFFTIVEVTAWDYPGLLFRITDALYQCGLDIWVAKIATRIDQVVDVFYVRSIEGEKADQPDQEEAVRQAVAEVLI